MDNNYIDIVSKIEAPVSSESPVGTAFASEDADYNFIDDEMMKIGSLSHGSIDWDKVEQTAIELLHKKSKDIKLLSYLLQCMQRDTDGDNIFCSIQVFESFLNHYWVDAFPSPGEKGKNLRSRLFKQIMQRNCQAAKRIEDLNIDSKLVAQTLDKLEQAIGNLQLDLELFQTLKTSFKKLEPDTDKGAVSEKKITEEESVAQVAPVLPKVYFDPKSERTSRQAFLAMASFLNQSDAENPLGYRVRRHAIWFAIRQLPASKEDKITELAAYSVERFQDYQSAVQQNPTIDLLNKLEKSIEQVPYWFDGHYLSYQLNIKLNNHHVAQAIQEEVTNIVTKFPDVLQYKASDGSCFASSETVKWLQQSGNNEQGKPTGEEQNWQQEYKKLVVMSETHGLRDALNFVDMQLKKAQNTREEYYWRLIAADLLNQQQLPSLAKNEYQVLLSNITGMSINDWEPSFTGHISHSLKNMENLGL